MRSRTALTTLVTASAMMLLTAVPTQAASPPPSSQCEVGKYYKLCVWTGPDYTGQVRRLGFNVDYLDIGPLFVVRSYKNWHASGRLIDICGQEHPLGEWAKDPNVNHGIGIPTRAIASGSS